LRATVAILPLAGLLVGCASRTVSPAPPSPSPARAATVTVRPPSPETPDAPALAELLARATRARADGRHADALELWEVVWSADPEYGGVADLLEEEYRIQGLDAFARGRTEEAVALWRKALRIDPDDHKTQAYLAHAEAQEARLGRIPGAATPTGQ
jgi:tetratricopeptide (TPR) repeat protein